jgi:uncharacterized membrane protein
LASAIGLSPLAELWIDLSLVLYAVIVACWIAAVRIEMRIRGLAREAALNAAPLSDAYRRLFRRWCLCAVPVLLGASIVVALMIWQPRFD